MSLKYAVFGMTASMWARERMQRTGKTLSGRHWLWTKEEDAQIINLYPDYNALVKLLPRRTHGGIQKRAAVLKLTKKYHIWNTREIATLRKMYPKASHAEIMVALPELRWGQIASCARRSGFRRARKPYKITGYQPIDDILRFAFENNLTLADIDTYAGSKKYFQKEQWISHGFTGHKAVLRAAIALGGIVRVEWE